MRFQVQATGIEITYQPTIFFTKLSLFLLYMRIFSCDRKMKYIIYFGVAANLVFTIIITAMQAVFTIPWRGETWLDPKHLARVEHSSVLAVPVGIFGVISDIYLLILPIPTTLKLNLPLRKRLGVIAIFMIGFL